MTFEETKAMITFLRENGAIQVNVGEVSAVFTEVARSDKFIELAPEHDPDAQRVLAQASEFDKHVKQRFGYSAEDILGG